MTIFVEVGREVSIPSNGFPNSEMLLLRNSMIGDGEGIHWESLDEDLLVSELIS